MDMAISEADYYRLKDYWDYQRKVEYNREKVYHMAERINSVMNANFNGMPEHEMKEMMWAKIPIHDYDDPPTGYIPEDPKLRLWYETWPPQLNWKKKLDDDYHIQK